MATREQQELSEEAVARITRVVRSLAEDRVERGIDLQGPMHCDSCDQEKASAGAALYGAYKLCNDCLLDFTLALASGTVDSVTEFMTKRTDAPGGMPPSGLIGHRDRSSVPLKPLPARDKFIPSNEPGRP